MSLIPTNPIPANYVSAGVINSFTSGVNSFETDQDGQGLKIINQSTNGYLEIGSGGFIVSPDGTSSFIIDPTNLSALVNNITPTILAINNELVIQNDDTTPTEIIEIEAGTNGGVGSLFGISYDSALNQDFIIQTTNFNTGGVIFKQFGIGSSTTQTKITNGTILSSNTANSNAITINASVPNIVITDGTNTNTITAIASGGSQTLQQVLTAGNNALTPLTAVIQDGTLSTTTTIRGNSIEVEIDDGINPAQLVGLTYNGLSHTGNGAGNNFTLSTDEKLLITSDNLTATGAGIAITSPFIGYTASPAITINNTLTSAGATTGVPSVETFKSGRNVIANDTIYSHQIYAKNYLGNKTLFGKIECVATSTGLSNDDGALDFYSMVNGTSSLVWRLNGADNENNSFRPIDMNGQDVKTSSGNMTISTASSSGTGDLTATAKRNVALNAGTAGSISGTTTDGNISFTANVPAGGTNGFCSMTADRGVALSSAQGGSDGNIILDVNNIGDLQLEGTTLISPSASGSSGQHLRIKLNGTYYKIQLLND